MGVIRLILALAVLQNHNGSFFIVSGSHAVILFFIISGFYMSLVINEKYSTLKNWKQLFLFNRFARLYPTYIAILFLTIIFHIYKGTPDIFTAQELNPFLRIIMIIFNIILIGQDLLITIDGGFFHKDIWEWFLILPSWTIGTELLFYIVAPFVVIKRHFTHVLAIILISLGIRAFFLFGGDFPTSPWLYQFFPSVLIFFIMGNISYLIYSQIIRYNNIASIGWQPMIILLLFVLFTNSKMTPGHNLDSIYHWITYSLFALTVPFVFLNSRNSKTDYLLGQLSYPIYLSHHLIIQIIRQAAIWNNEIFSAYLYEVKLFTSIIVTIIFSILIVMIIEIPIDKARHRITNLLNKTEK